MNNTEQKNPSFELAYQFLRDVTLENVAPFEFFNVTEDDVATDIDVDVDVGTGENNMFEITLTTKISIAIKGTKRFILELQYVGIFQIRDADDSILPFLAFVQCPHFLFPSVRHLVRTFTQESGIPPLNLQNVNFLQLFEKKYADNNNLMA